MSLNLSPYPQCCKAVVIHGFGAGHLFEHGDAYKDARLTQKEITNFLNKNIRILSSQGIQVLFACPTNHQPEAIEALTEFGFHSAPTEDLKAVERKERVGIRSADGSVERYEEIVHQMHPMFYLIPPYKR